MLVYILSEYDEDGAKNVRVTLRPELLPSMIDGWGEGAWPSGKYKTEAKATLAALLAREPHNLIDPDGHHLHSGWGGAMLHVVELKDG